MSDPWAEEVGVCFRESIPPMGFEDGSNRAHIRFESPSSWLLQTFVLDSKEWRTSYGRTPPLPHWEALLIGQLGTSGNHFELDKILSGQGLKLFGGDMLYGIEIIGRELFGNIGGDHLAITLGDFEGTIDAANKVAHHDISHPIQFFIRNRFVFESVYF